MYMVVDATTARWSMEVDTRVSAQCLYSIAGWRRSEARHPAPALYACGSTAARSPPRPARCCPPASSTARPPVRLGSAPRASCRGTRRTPAATTRPAARRCPAPTNNINECEMSLGRRSDSSRPEVATGPATSSIEANSRQLHRQAEQAPPKGNPTPPSAHLTPDPSSPKEHFEETGQKERLGHQTSASAHKCSVWVESRARSIRRERASE